MTTVTNRKHNVTHYAYYGDLYGTAELLNGSGYLFREEGQRKAMVVSYKDPELLLLGHVDGSVHMTQDTCGKQVLPSRF
jgi:hypothetical protein